MSPGVGYACAVASTVLAGSWQATSKVDAIRKHQLHPFVLVCEVMLGVFLISWAALLPDGWSGFSFTPWGLLGGFLFAGSMTLNLAVSFPVLGIAVGSGIASCVVCLTSLFWSAVVFKQDMRSVALASVGVVVVIIGLVLIILTGRYFAVVPPMSAQEVSEKQSGGGDDGEAASETSPLVESSSSTSSSTAANPIHAAATTPEGGGEARERTASSGGSAPENQAAASSSVVVVVSETRFRVAVLGALCAGVFGGSYLMPEHVADDDTDFLPSMGIGCLLFAPICGGFSILAVRPSPERPLRPSWEVIKETLPWGVLGGAVNALAIILVIKAMDDIDYVVANTLSQTSIFVAGLWGWLLFGEISGQRAVGAFFLSSTVLVGGAVVVGYFGTTR